MSSRWWSESDTCGVYDKDAKEDGFAAPKILNLKSEIFI